MGLEPTVISVLRRGAQVFPNREVVGADARVTYSQLLDNAERLASYLADRGVGKGDVVAVADLNTVRFMELVYAVSLLNAIIMPVNYRLPPAILGDIINDVRPKLFLYSQPLADMAKLAGPSKVLQLESSIPEGLTRSPLRSEPDPDADYVLLFTSGTTGKPKGVMYPQWKMVLGALSIAHQLSTYNTPAKLDGSDTMMTLIPMFHILSWGSVFQAPFLGAKLVLVDKFDPQRVIELIRREGVTWINAVPTMIVMLLETGARFNNLKALVGGSPISAPLAKRMREAGIRFSTIYGGTDMLATSISVLTDHTGEDQLNVVTHPVPFAEVKVVKDNGEEARPGEMGEIWYRSPWMPSGYFRNPEKTRESFVNGWFRTGDLGEPTPDGGVKVLDRVTDAIKSGGEWIPSSVLESIIGEVEGVRMVAVVPVKHEKWGERPVAVVVGSASEEKIMEHLRRAVDEGRILKWWIPDKIVKLNELPLTSTGKVDKRAVIARLGDALG